MKKTVTSTLLAIILSLVFTGNSHAAKPDGLALYRAICAKCHSSIENTTIPSRRLARIKSAIATNIGGMGALKYLKDDELKAVADVLYLAGLKEDEADGKELYGMLCSGCHKAAEKSDIKGKTAADIQSAMKAGKCASSSSPRKLLTDKEISRIADALKEGGKGGKEPPRQPVKK